MKVEIVSESGEIQHPKIQHIKDTEEVEGFYDDPISFEPEPLPYAEQVKLAIERMRK